MEVAFQRRCVRCVPFVCCTGRREVFIRSFCTIDRWSYRRRQTVWTGKWKGWRRNSETLLHSLRHFCRISLHTNSATNCNCSSFGSILIQIHLLFFFPCAPGELLQGILRLFSDVTTSEQRCIFQNFGKVGNSSSSWNCNGEWNFKLILRQVEEAQPLKQSGCAEPLCVSQSRVEPEPAALGVLTLCEPVGIAVLGTQGCQTWQRLSVQWQLDCCGCCWPRAREVFLDNLELLAGSSWKIP